VGAISAADQMLGFDPIWFGVIRIVTAEVGMITPPVGSILVAFQSIIFWPPARMGR
jgi:TRAP-type C4-dicarboxylate transport system permease large subunit